MDSSTDLPPISDETSPPEPSRPRRRRWQVIVLIIGLVLIAGAIAFTLLAGPASVPNAIDTAYSDTQTYTEAIVGQPQWVDPLLATSQADRDLSALVFSGLTRLDDYGQPVPDLAEKWEVTPDGLTYTFHLRQGVTWHDGQPFTADDVAFTMSLLRDPDFPGPADLGTFWQTVETYADDPMTVRFVLTQPLAAFPEYAGVGILPSHILGGIPAKELPKDPFNLAPIGTGRLRWLAMDKELTGSTVRLKPYAGYYDQARAIHLNEVALHFFDDTNRAFRSMDSGSQAFGGLTPAQLNVALGAKNITLYSARLPAYTAIMFNQAAPAKLPFFKDKAVRQALAMALDRQSITSQVLPREALLANSTVLPGTWAYNPAITPLPYDAASAAQTLDQAGWTLQGGARANKDNVRIAFTLLADDGPVERQIGQAIVGAWRGLGIDVTLQTLPADKLLDRLTSAPSGDQGHDFDAALVEFNQGRISDPDPYPFWHESQIATGQNFSGFSDRDISEILELARKDPNGVRRAELYRSFQQLFAERAAAILFYNPVYHYAVSCQIQGVQIMILVDPSDRFRNMDAWRILPPDRAKAACGGG